MGQTVQKKIKFNKGQITPKLVERTDLSILDNSCSYAKNVVSTIHGGLKNRYGTNHIDELIFGGNELIGTATSSLGDASNVQSTGFTTNAILSDREIFEIDLGSSADIGQFKMFGVKLDYEAPVVKYVVSTHLGDCYVSRIYIQSAGKGITSNATFNLGNSRWDILPEITYTLNTDGSLASITLVEAGHASRVGSGTSTAKFNRNEDIRSYNATLYGSADDINWTIVDSRLINEEAQDFSILVDDNYQYVKWEIDTTTDSIGTTMSIVQAYYLEVGIVPTDCKILSYKYSNEQEYIFALGNETILVYKDGIFQYSIQATGLYDTYFPALKYTYKDDTIIFTHQDMPTKQLKRTPDTEWEWKDFEFLYLPFKAFGEITTTNKTTSITPSATSGEIFINAGSSFFLNPYSDWVGQIIEGNGGVFVITEVSSPLTVRGYTLVDFLNTNAINSWKLKSGYEPIYSKKTYAWYNASDSRTIWTEKEDPSIGEMSWYDSWFINDYYEITSTGTNTITANSIVYTRTSASDFFGKGFPATCLFAQQRLLFAGSPYAPSTIIGSRLADYNNFSNMYGDDAESINGIDLMTNEQIVNLSNQRDLQIFTQGEVFRNSFNNMTATTFNPVKQVSVGSYKNVLPAIIDGQIIFADYLGKNLYSYVYNYNEDAYNSSNLSILNDLMDTPISIASEIDSLNDKNNYLYVVKEDGSMLVNSLKQSSDINATTQFITDGLIKDVASIGGSTYLIVERNSRYYLEKISDIRTDCTLTFSVNGTLIENLPEGFNNKYVWVYNDDEVIGRYICENNAVELDSSISGSYYVGIAFNYEVIGNNIAINGQTFAKKKRIAKAQLVCYETEQISFMGKTKTQENNDLFDFYACSPYKNNIQYTIEGEFYPFELLSLQLWINYGEL